MYLLKLCKYNIFILILLLAIIKTVIDWKFIRTTANSFMNFKLKSSPNLQ